MWSKNRSSFLRPLKNKGFKEEIVTKIGVYDILKSTPLESNKSLRYLAKVLIRCHCISQEVKGGAHLGGRAAGCDSIIACVWRLPERRVSQIILKRGYHYPDERPDEGNRLADAT